MDSNYDPRADAKYAEASKRWANLGILLVIVAILVGMWWFTETYYGPDGVRVLGVGFAILGVILIIIGIGFGINAVTAGLFMRLYLGVLNGLVRHEEADDRGEIARSLVGVAKVQKQMERDVLRGSIQMGRQYGNALVQAQRGQDRQQLVDAQAAWFNAPAQFDDDNESHGRTPEGW
jgi:hypothetical protein